MSERHTTLEKFQNGKPNPKKTQFVVSCVKDGSIKEIEKLQNKETVKGLYLSTVLTKANRTFLEERSNEGTIDDLVTLIRAVWDNYQFGQLITLVEQSNQALQEIPNANFRIDHPRTKVHGGDC
jgi:hypothetical protein